MKAIIIAAGSSKRLRPLTNELPKCMLKIEGKPIIQNTIELFQANGISDISIIRGWKGEKINFPNIAYFENDDFLNNNILHSLMYARAKLEEAVETKEEMVISYSDIWYNDSIVKALLKDKHDIASIVDTDWQHLYEGRTEHPISEAEKVIMDNNKRIIKIGKRVLIDDVPKDKLGEFIGLWKFTPKGIKIFLKHFDVLNKKLRKEEPFQNAKEWQKSYITDIFQEMIHRGEEIYCILVKNNWREFDTMQDFLLIGGEIS